MGNSAYSLQMNVLSSAKGSTSGVDDKTIVKEYMLTNRNVFWPTLKKCVAVGLLTWNWSLVKTVYASFMARKELIGNPGT
ncbi:MAG: hypothetical protein IJ069_00275 [Prevotella sp.]|nr:hypothetical protein [Prevotella sp.]